MIPAGLQAFLDAGVPVIASSIEAGPVGSFKTDPEYQRNFTTDPARVQNWIRMGFIRFQYVPFRNGWITLDIDRKDGKDGFLSLLGELDKAGITLPWDLADPPVWVETPNNGMQIIMSLPNREPIPLRADLKKEGIEAKGSMNLLATASGSMKKREDGTLAPYVLHGNLKAVPVIPKRLADLLKQKQETVKRFVLHMGEKPKGLPSWETMERKVSEQGRPYSVGTRNDFIFSMAHWAKKQGRPIEETADYLLGRCDGVPAHSIKATVRSAYK